MGTAISAVNVLIEHGLKDAIIAITHGIFSGSALERINDCQELIAVITTNSLPQEENLARSKKIEVLDCAPLISCAIDGIVTGKSISQLFM